MQSNRWNIGKSIKALQEMQNAALQGNTQSLSEEEIDKIIKERFSGKFANHLGPMKSIPEDSILNAPVFSDDYGCCVVQEPYNKLMPK